MLRHWDPAEDGIDPSLLIHMSPIGWDNIVLYGEYALDRSLVARYPRYGRGLGVENSRRVDPMALRSLGFGLSVHFYIILPATLVISFAIFRPWGCPT